MGLLCECLEFIDAHAVQVLESDDIEDLNRPCLKFLLKRDSLNAPEQAIFYAIVRYATYCVNGITTLYLLEVGKFSKMLLVLMFLDGQKRNANGYTCH